MNECKDCFMISANMEIRSSLTIAMMVVRHPYGPFKEQGSIDTLVYHKPPTL